MLPRRAQISLTTAYRERFGNSKTLSHRHRFFGEFRIYKSFWTRQDFSDDEAALLFLRDFIFGVIQNVRTATQRFG